MNNWVTKVFPATMILLDLMAALMCGVAGDLRKTVYWLAAAVLNAAVTFQEGLDMNEEYLHIEKHPRMYLVKTYVYNDEAKKLLNEKKGDTK